MGGNRPSNPVVNTKLFLGWRSGLQLRVSSDICRQVRFENVIHLVKAAASSVCVAMLSRNRASQTEVTRGVKMSGKAERDEIRGRMLGLGCSIEQMAIEMGRRFNARPRLAWRYALGWTQVQLAHRYNELNPKASIGAERVSECENWPLSRSRPSLKYLVGLALTFGHGCTAIKLTDLEDLSAMPNADRLLLLRAIAGVDPIAMEQTRETPHLLRPIVGLPITRRENDPLAFRNRLAG